MIGTSLKEINKIKSTKYTIAKLKGSQIFYSHYDSSQLFL